MLMDRVHPAEQHHVHEMHVTVDHNQEAIASLRAFKDLGVSREKLLELYGWSGLGRYEKMIEDEDRKSGKLIAGSGPVIEAQATEIAG